MNREDPMTTPRLDAIEVGDLLLPLTLPPVDRTMLALFAGASGDHNAVHIDLDFARRAGMPDVFAHGMLSMAWLGQVLTGWVAQPAIRELSVRFAAITHVGERITCAAKVVEKFERQGQRCVRVALTTCNQDGLLKLSGEAVLAIS